MKPRDFLNFLKTKSGKLVVFGALFAGGLTIFSVIRQHHTASEVAATPLATNNVSGKPEVVQTVMRPMQVFNPPPPKSTPPPASPARSTSSLPVLTNSSPQPLPNVPPRQTESLTPISLFADSAAGMVRPKKLSAAYAPFGRLIPCETVITVDSSSMQTPIIGLVTENIYLRRQADYSGGHGSSRHGADRPAARTHRGQHQLDADLAGWRGNAA